MPEDILALRPAILVGVPRVWERVVASAKERIKRRGPLSRALFGWACRSVYTYICRPLVVVLVSEHCYSSASQQTMKLVMLPLAASGGAAE